MQVLIIEDDVMVADLVEETLVERGYQCTIARTVDEAIAVAQRLPPDLAIVDCRLADGSHGTDVAPLLMTQFNAGILYTTGSMEMIATAVGHACLRKPFQLADLLIGLEFVASVVRGTTRPQPPAELLILCKQRSRPE